MDSASGTNSPDAPRPHRAAERLLACFQKALGHELPNQLVAVQGLLYLLGEEEGQRLGPEGRDCLERLGAVVRRMHGLVKELAEVGRAVRQPPGRGQALLRDAAEEVLAETRVLSPGAAIEYHLVDPGLPLPLPEAALRQLLAVLLRHAVRRVAGRPLRVEVGGRAAGPAAELWVTDDGPPLSPAERQQLADPFAGDDAGAGLRLFLCSLLVDAAGGRLDVESSPDAGNRFTITLPPGPPS